MARIEVLDLLSQYQCDELTTEEQKAVVGGGPAGCAAGALVGGLAESVKGLVTLTPWQENYKNIAGSMVGGCIVGAIAPTP